MKSLHDSARLVKVDWHQSNDGRSGPEHAILLGYELYQALGVPCVTPLALAATADTNLALHTGRYLAEELVKQGIEVVIGPNIGIDDSDVWGMGTDPSLSGKMLQAFTKGMIEGGVTPLVNLTILGRVENTLAELDTGLFSALKKALATEGVGIVLPDAVFSSIDESAIDRSRTFITGFVRGVFGCSGPVAVCAENGREDEYSSLNYIDIDVVLKPAERMVADTIESADTRPAYIDRVASSSVTLLRDRNVLPISDVNPILVQMGIAGDYWGPNVPRGFRNDRSFPVQPSAEQLSELHDELTKGRSLIAFVAKSLVQRWQGTMIEAFANIEGRGCIIVIALENPADCAVFPTADVLCAAYGQKHAGCETVLELVRGQGKWNGRLPVDIGRCLRTDRSANSDTTSLVWYTTEIPNSGTRHLERMTVRQLVEEMNRIDESVVHAVREQTSNIEQAIELVVESLSSGGNVYYLGAGSAGRIGILDATEIPPTFGLDSKRVQAIMAGGASTTAKAKEDDEDDAIAAQRELVERGFGTSDLLIAITAHGATPYARGGVAAARRLGGKTIALVNNIGTPVAQMSDVAIEVLSGAELLVGSTRLKSGTSEKLVLNMLSTISMVCLGRVYDNLMIDFQPTNIKLQERAENVVMWVAGCSRKSANTYLQQADWDVKLACALGTSGLSKEEAKKALSGCNGLLGEFLDRSKGVFEVVDSDK